ncbi:MAG: hypothetical protein HY245_01175 [Rhizobiales bacterium]|nr:hypothetical protein [Hyphomicrobiales bacterium]
MSGMGPVDLYGLVAVLAEDAKHLGLPAFALSLEKPLAELLIGLPREDQGLALCRAYELALDGEAPAPPPIRLVYSKD